MTQIQQRGSGTPVNWEELIPVTLIAALALESMKKEKVGGKKRKGSKRRRKSSKRKVSKKRKSSTKRRRH
jgi:hypothetical protein